MLSNLPNLDPATQRKLQWLLDRYPAYDIKQDNGQRQFGPPTPTPPAPPKGCEVFVGKLPRDVYEDELVPVLSRAGPLFKMRLMMDFSGTTRGYSFVQYMNRRDAETAVQRLNGFEVRRGHRIAVTKSLDNCRLYIGGLSVSQSREEIADKLRASMNGVIKVFMYSDPQEVGKHRGFAFVEFGSHREAALARRSFYPSPLGDFVTIDWAEAEVEVDEQTMSRVKVLFVRNVLAHVTESAIRRAFARTLPPDSIEKVKKCKDFAFVHFFTRESAEACKKRWNGQILEGAELQVSWAKPVSREQNTTHKIMNKLQRWHIGAEVAADNRRYRQRMPRQLVLPGHPFHLPPSVSANQIMPAGVSPSELGVDISSIVRLADRCAKFGFAQPFFQFLVKSRPHRDDLAINACKVTLVGCNHEARSFRCGSYHRTALHAQVAVARFVLDNWNCLEAASEPECGQLLRNETCVSPSFQHPPPPPPPYQSPQTQVSREYRPVPGEFGPVPGEYRPVPGEFRPVPGEYRPVPGEFRPVPGCSCMSLVAAGYVPDFDQPVFANEQFAMAMYDAMKSEPGNPGPGHQMAGFPVPPPGYYETMFYDQCSQSQCT